MKVEQIVYRSLNEKEILKNDNLGDKAQMVLLFGSKGMLFNKELINTVRLQYPKAYVMGCTTAGEIFDSQVADDTLTVTAIYLEKSKVIFSSVDYESDDNCYEAAKGIAESLPKEGLRHVFVLSEGVNTNGSSVVKGFKEFLPNNVPLTGGLAGDGGRFIETFILCNDSVAQNRIVAAAFYGDKLRTGYGSVGGWDQFGIERIVTRSDGCELYDLDGKPALDIYKEYLGEYAKDLPSTGIFFPLSIRAANSNYTYVRTIRAVDEKKKSLIFAGDVPQGYLAKLMRANFNNLVNGSMQAAQISIAGLGMEESSVAILISCAGRKMVLKQMVDEEIEVAREILGNNTVITGFYSNGEISPAQKGVECNFHNQTMTITLLGEE